MHKIENATCNSCNTLLVIRRMNEKKKPSQSVICLWRNYQLYHCCRKKAMQANCGLCQQMLYLLFLRSKLFFHPLTSSLPITPTLPPLCLSNAVKHPLKRYIHRVKHMDTQIHTNPAPCSILICRFTAVEEETERQRQREREIHS